MSNKRILLLLRIAVAIILIQTLRFKFTAHPDSVFIFETLGLEPHGRIVIGGLELIAGLLLLIRRMVWVGAVMTVALLGGAIGLHLTKLGIRVNGDGGILFCTALVTFIMANVILFAERKTIPFIGSKF